LGAQTLYSCLTYLDVRILRFSTSLLERVTFWTPGWTASRPA